jgi:hypothetical protein
LNLILTFDEEVEHLLGVHSRFTEVGHQTNEGSVPLVCNLGEGSGATGHKNLSDTILKLLQALFIDLDESLGSDFLSILILEPPSAILLTELLLYAADLGKNADFKAVHVE